MYATAFTIGFLNTFLIIPVILVALRNVLRDGWASGFYLGVGNAFAQIFWMFGVFVLLHFVSSDRLSTVREYFMGASAVTFFVLAYSLYRNSVVERKALTYRGILNRILFGFSISILFLVYIIGYLSVFHHYRIPLERFTHGEWIQLALVVAAGNLFWWFVATIMISWVFPATTVTRKGLKIYNNIMVSMLFISGIVVSLLLLI